MSIRHGKCGTTAVILESGGRNFTLDAVAERAGISKGGLVYSFATKDELVRATLERELARFQAPHPATPLRLVWQWKW
jgi:AcrR family transcriptional regulator